MALSLSQSMNYQLPSTHAFLGIKLKPELTTLHLDFRPRPHLSPNLDLPKLNNRKYAVHGLRRGAVHRGADAKILSTKPKNLLSPPLGIVPPISLQVLTHDLLLVRPYTMTYGLSEVKTCSFSQEKG